MTRAAAGAHSTAAQCIICASADVLPIDEIPPVPIDTNRMWFSRAEAHEAPKAQISLVYCSTCDHVFNRSYNDDLVDYETDYENSQVFSPRFRRYVEELVETLIANHNLHNKRIVEIGGGRGEFLRLLCDRGGNQGVVIGPSYQAKQDEIIPPNVRFIKDYYTAKYRSKPADIIICRHVLEHFWGARELIKTVREAVDAHRDPVVYFEVPNGDYILSKRVFWEFHYQHVSYFTKRSLSTLFTECGFEVCQVQEHYEGQFLGIVARAAASNVASDHNHRMDGKQATTGPWQAFGKAFRAQIASWLDRLELWRAYEMSIVAWGAGAKAVTFLNLVDPAGDLISHIVDINPRKAGCFVPGSGQEIVEPSALRGLRPDVIILMNDIYRNEIEATVHALGFDPILLVA